MRLPRFRLRTLLVAVAIAGLACGVVIERQRRFETLAESHRTKYVELVGPIFSGFPDFWSTSPASNWHGKMWHKYERAARYPWLPVEPDRPEPE